VLGIDNDMLGDLPVQWASTSRPKLMINLKSRKIMDNLKPDFEYLWKVCDKTENSGFYVFAFEGNDIYARQFPNNTGYLEDPATGIAAGALGCYLVKYGIGNGRYNIYQGQAMARPSLIGREITTEKGEITKVEIFGKAEFLKEKAKSL